MMEMTRNLFADNKEEEVVLIQALHDSGYKLIGDMSKSSVYAKQDGDTLCTEVLWRLYLMNQ